ncbi:MAG TPA: Rieske 2Fe-2S domain-containing protein [Actinomycetota bacterium]|jgi:ubiquinol-cytochrome c reductase iron-sulfur subunit|nr:Rieske 2Fe-2S domain-containing protein [Actinomycetota bacterium]
MTRRRAPARWIAIALVASTAASIALAAVYALGGQPQFEGALLGVALGGIALALIGWAHAYLPHGPFEEEREEMSRPAATAEAEVAFQSGAAEIERRGFLVRLGVAAAAALGVAAVFPIRSLGTRPGRSLYRTEWGPGVRLVTADGEAIRADDVDVHAFLTVFPDGHTDAADSQTVLIRLPEDILTPIPGRETWSPQGFVAFSKICTHAGCPVGLYAAQTRELFCPCHQSVFDVQRAARPMAGPATRALPQLPLAIDDEGFLIAGGDFPEPVGPGFWARPKG